MSFSAQYHFQQYEPPRKYSASKPAGCKGRSYHIDTNCLTEANVKGFWKYSTAATHPFIRAVHEKMLFIQVYSNLWCYSICNSLRNFKDVALNLLSIQANNQTITVPITDDDCFTLSILKGCDCLKQLLPQQLCF